MLGLLLLAAAAAGQTFAVDPSTGYLRAILFKEGPLQALGHDHVLEARDYEGRAMLARSSATLRLEIPAEWLDMDHPAARAAEGLKSELGDGDRAKVREGMRGAKGLDIARFPKIAFASRVIEPVASTPGMWLITGTLSLHGVDKDLQFPARLTAAANGYWAEGELRLRQSEFGIKPFSVAAGMVRVRDDLLLRFRLRLVSGGRG